MIPVIWSFNGNLWFIFLRGFEKNKICKPSALVNDESFVHKGWWEVFPFICAFIWKILNFLENFYLIYFDIIEDFDKLLIFRGHLYLIYMYITIYSTSSKLSSFLLFQDYSSWIFHKHHFGNVLNRYDQIFNGHPTHNGTKIS